MRPAEVKLVAIRFADWVDDKVLQYRFYWLCCKIANSKWWGDP